MRMISFSHYKNPILLSIFSVLQVIKLRLREDSLPSIITEKGIALLTDSEKKRYIKKHIG